MASFVGGTDCAAGWASCFELQPRHVRLRLVPGGRVGGFVPINTQGVLKHLDAAHEVELDIVERAAFALEERNAGLRAAGGGWVSGGSCVARAMRRGRRLQQPGKRWVCSAFLTQRCVVASAGRCCGGADEPQTRRMMEKGGKQHLRMHGRAQVHYV